MKRWVPSFCLPSVIETNHKTTREVGLFYKTSRFRCIVNCDIASLYTPMFGGRFLRAVSRLMNLLSIRRVINNISLFCSHFHSIGGTFFRHPVCLQKSAMNTDMKLDFFIKAFSSFFVLVGQGFHHSLLKSKQRNLA